MHKEDAPQRDAALINALKSPWIIMVPCRCMWNQPVDQKSLTEGYRDATLQGVRDAALWVEKTRSTNMSLRVEMGTYMAAKTNANQAGSGALSHKHAQPRRERAHPWMVVVGRVV